MSKLKMYEMVTLAIVAMTLILQVGNYSRAMKWSMLRCIESCSRGYVQRLQLAIIVLLRGKYMCCKKGVLHSDAYGSNCILTLLAALVSPKTGRFGCGLNLQSHTPKPVHELNMN